MTFQNNLKGYKLVLKESAQKDLGQIDPLIAHAIEKKLQALVLGATNLDIKKMADCAVPTYRLRHGDYRAIYEVYKNEIIVLVVRIGHRQSIYKRFR